MEDPSKSRFYQRSIPSSSSGILVATKWDSIDQYLAYEYQNIASSTSLDSSKAYILESISRYLAKSPYSHQGRAIQRRFLVDFLFGPDRLESLILTSTRYNDIYETIPFGTTSAEEAANLPKTEYAKLDEWLRVVPRTKEQVDKGKTLQLADQRKKLYHPLRLYVFMIYLESLEEERILREVEKRLVTRFKNAAEVERQQIEKLLERLEDDKSGANILQSFLRDGADRHTRNVIVQNSKDILLRHDTWRETWKLREMFLVRHYKINRDLFGFFSKLGEKIKKSISPDKPKKVPAVVKKEGEEEEKQKQEEEQQQQQQEEEEEKKHAGKGENRELFKLSRLDYEKGYLKRKMIASFYKSGTNTDSNAWKKLYEEELEDLDAVMFQVIGADKSGPLSPENREWTDRDKEAFQSTFKDKKEIYQPNELFHPERFYKSFTEPSGDNPLVEQDALIKELFGMSPAAQKLVERLLTPADKRKENPAFTLAQFEEDLIFNAQVEEKIESLEKTPFYGSHHIYPSFDCGTEKGEENEIATKFGISPVTSEMWRESELRYLYGGPSWKFVALAKWLYKDLYLGNKQHLRGGLSPIKEIRKSQEFFLGDSFISTGKLSLSLSSVEKSKQTLAKAPASDKN